MFFKIFDKNKIVKYFLFLDVIRDEMRFFYLCVVCIYFFMLLYFLRRKLSKIFLYSVFYIIL